MFEKMHAIIPEGESGSASVSHFEVSADDVSLTNMRLAMSGNGRDSIRPGKYVQLKIGGALYMSDTQMEQRSNAHFVGDATGDVLIAGLGIGLIIAPLLKKESVTSITVIEKYQDVIDLVAPHLKSDKLTIVCADILEWKPEKGQKFDTIYFDVWADICEDNLDEIAILHRRFKSYKRSKESFMDSWQRDRLLYERRRNKNSYW